MDMKRTAAGIMATLMMATAMPAALAEGGADGSDAAETAAENLTEAITEAVEDAAAAITEAVEENAASAGTASATAGGNQLLTTSESQKLDAAYTLALNAINAEDYETAKEYINICFAYCDAQSDPVMFSDLLLKRACIDVIEGKNDMALLNLDAAIHVNPDLADAYLVRTQVYASQGDADRAIASLEKYIELTQDTSLYQTVAQLEEARGNIKAAQAAYDKYVQGAGAEVEEAGFQAGLYKLQSGSFEEAVAAFEAYLDNETYKAGAYYNIGLCKMNLGDYPGAVEAFTNSEANGGAFEGLYYNRGVSSLLNGDWANAAIDFAKSIETEPFVDDARYNLGICQLQTEDYEGAVATFTACIGDGEQADDSAEDLEINYGAYYYRAACRAALGLLDDAIADYTACIEKGYELGQSYYQRAQVYAALGDTEKQNADLAESLKYSD